jgi:alkanesulfonate monooxygenase SsuD/methylene tetrahydromethanopterin reductase-like flavin-dependent oxidoreductase (luciferase family)
MDTGPFARGSVSLRLYPPRLDDPTAVLDELISQARLAVDAGFDGVLLSERHGGAWGQIPNPLQAAGWILDALGHGWVAPCPLLLPFRNAGVVAEELAWLAARFPGRVGAGFGSGGNAPDFAAMGVPFDERAARFVRTLVEVVAILRGAEPHPLHADRAIARARAEGLPLLSAAMSATAARRAGALGIGIIGSSLLDDTRTAALEQTHREAGGRGPHVMIVRAWLGEPPWSLIERQLHEYRSAPDATRTLAGGEGDLEHHDDPAVLAGRIVGRLHAVRATACNVRVHAAGLEPAVAREQIVRMGDEVVPLVRKHWMPAR